MLAALQGRYGGGAPVRRGSERPRSGLERGGDFPLLTYKLKVGVHNEDFTQRISHLKKNTRPL